jgi:hypothetical protein
MTDSFAGVSSSAARGGLPRDPNHLILLNDDDAIATTAVEQR